MTTRHAAYLVTLAEDTRSDDAEDIVTALRMVKGVIKVEPVPASIDVSIAKARVDSDWHSRILDLLNREP